MQGTRRLVTFVLFALGTAAIADGGAPTHAQSKACEVKITSPKPGDKVGATGRVRGTARLPPGTHLWVLAHMKDLTAEWWPQGGRAAIIEPDGTWVIIAGYGQRANVGEDFEVAAVVVSSETNDWLKRWFEHAKAVNSYDPIEFPSAAEGCVPVKITVTKTAHQ